MSNGVGPQVLPIISYGPPPKHGFLLFGTRRLIWGYTVCMLISSKNEIKKILFQNHEKSLHTKPLAFTVSVMTFWKAVLYITTFYVEGPDLRKNNTVFEEVTMMLLPSLIWVVVPLMCVGSLWQDYLHDYSLKRY